MTLVSDEHFFSQWYNLFTIFSHLDEACEENGFAGHAALGQLLLDHLELSYEALARLVCDKISKL